MNNLNILKTGSSNFDNGTSGWEALILNKPIVNPVIHFMIYYQILK